jgi:hypothetical protein
MFTDVQLPVRQGWGWGQGEARIHPAAPTPLPCRTRYCTSVQFANFVRELLLNIASGTSPQSTQSDGPVRFLIFCFLLFLLVFSYFFPQMTSADVFPPRGGGIFQYIDPCRVYSTCLYYLLFPFLSVCECGPRQYSIL